MNGTLNTTCPACGGVVDESQPGLTLCLACGVWLHVSRAGPGQPLIVQQVRGMGQAIRLLRQPPRAPAPARQESPPPPRPVNETVRAIAALGEEDEPAPRMVKDLSPAAPPPATTITPLALAVGFVIYGPVIVWRLGQARWRQRAARREPGSSPPSDPTGAAAADRFYPQRRKMETAPAVSEQEDQTTWFPQQEWSSFLRRFVMGGLLLCAAAWFFPLVLGNMPVADTSPSGEMAVVLMQVIEQIKIPLTVITIAAIGMTKILSSFFESR